MNTIRIGITGFGRLGQQIYRLALADHRYEVVAVSDFGSAKILHQLLTKSMPGPSAVDLEGNYLIGQRLGTDGAPIQKTRVLPAGRADQIPWWDVFGTEIVIDATGHPHTLRQLTRHVENGARRVILSSLPGNRVDRVVLFGINHHQIAPGDQIVSVGSASTTATALALQIMHRAAPIEHATITSVHAYTDDQILQDHAGPDYRRSRSGARNIIPNQSPAPYWVQRALPKLSGKISGYAMNVPVQTGSLLDLTVAFTDAKVSAPFINDLFTSAAAQDPELIATTEDPIVSSDVNGCSQSILVDLKATLKAGSRLIKLLAWHESLGHARRILDLAAAYGELDAAPRREAS